MIGTVRFATLIWIAVAIPALAQTAATPGSVTSNGIVTLGTGTSVSAGSSTIANPATATQATPGTTTGGSATGSAGGAPSTGGASGGASGSRSSTTSSSGANSGGSSGSAATAPSISVPAWVLCPPSGALGLQPFLAGTDISCAP